jgi:hemerythrin-like metal-binding protein
MDIKDIISSYARFIPHQLIALLNKQDVTELKLGDQVEKKLTILFTDIRDFTSLSEKMSPQENFNFLNSFLSQMEPLISVNDGIVDKFIGDAIMAIFPRDANDALTCALQMQKQLRLYNAGRSRAGYAPIRIGIGLNTGIAMVGTVGGYNRMDGTVISDAVNMASRIEGMTKTYNAGILLSENTYHNLAPHLQRYVRFLDRTSVKGKKHAQNVYEAFGYRPDEERDAMLENTEMFEEAVAHYYHGDINASRDLLMKCASADYEDGPVELYLNRCVNFEAEGFDPMAFALTNPIRWGDRFLLNEGTIDDQHKKLVEASSQLVQNAMVMERSKFAEELEALKERILTHFQYEENAMERTGYAFIAHQQDQHARFVASLEQLIVDARDESVSNSLVTFRVQVLLVDWLVTHTLREDKHFGRHLSKISQEATE